MIINITQLISNPGLEELLVKKNQELLTCKARMENGHIVFENLTYSVTDPELITFIKIKYNLAN